MRLRSPAEFHLKALVVHPDQFDTATIKERLIDEGLDFISLQYIDGLRNKLKPPKPFYPTDTTHSPSLRFILNERINRAFIPDAAMRSAREILETPRAKEFVESMLLVNAPLSAIAGFISKHKNIHCTVEVLEVYQHYFWNTDLLDSTQMRILLQLRIDTAAESIPEFKDKKKALTSAYYKDPRTVAANLPYSPTSAMLAQMRLGIRPSKAEIALRMMETRDIAWMRAIEAAQTDGPGDDQKFMNYVNGGRILEELLQMVARPEDQLRKQLSAIGLKTELAPVKSIHALTEGRHTVEVAPIKDGSDDSNESAFDAGFDGPEGSDPGAGDVDGSE